MGASLAKRRKGALPVLRGIENGLDIGIGIQSNDMVIADIDQRGRVGTEGEGQWPRALARMSFRP